MRSLQNFSHHIKKQSTKYCRLTLLRTNIRCYHSHTPSHLLSTKYCLHKKWCRPLALYSPRISHFTTESTAPVSQLPIAITKASCKRLNVLKKKRENEQLMLRVAVSSGGCSGFQYEFEFANPSDIETSEDIVLTKDNAQFVIDKTSLKFIKGATLDFVEDFIQTSFVVVDNPNIVSECGCNVSFTPNSAVLEDDDEDEENDT
eukprot:385877_1